MNMLIMDEHTAAGSEKLGIALVGIGGLVSTKKSANAAGALRAARNNERACIVKSLNVQNERQMYNDV